MKLRAKVLMEWWLDGFIARHDIQFYDAKDQHNFKKYYIYHRFKRLNFPIQDEEYRPEFREIRFFVDRHFLHKSNHISSS